MKKQPITLEALDELFKNKNPQSIAIIAETDGKSYVLPPEVLSLINRQEDGTFSLGKVVKLISQESLDYTGGAGTDYTAYFNTVQGFRYFVVMMEQQWVALPTDIDVFPEASSAYKGDAGATNTFQPDSSAGDAKIAMVSIADGTKTYTILLQYIIVATKDKTMVLGSLGKSMRVGIKVTGGATNGVIVVDVFGVL